MKFIRVVFGFLLVLVCFGACNDASQATDSPAAVYQATAKDIFPLRICTQNLNRFGSTQRKMDPRRREKQKSYLVSRMKRAKCKIIAVQEVFGKTKAQAKKSLEELAASLEKGSGIAFDVHVGESNDEWIRNGFLVARDIGAVEDVRNFWREEVPKLDLLGPPIYYSRGPLGIVVRLPVGEDVTVKRLFLVTMHFKSKASSWKDPTGLQFEAFRLQSAEGLRQAAIHEAKSLGTGTLLVVLGDRNSDEGSAATDVLSGRRQLEDFRRKNGCAIDKGLKPACGERPPRPAQLPGLFSWRGHKFPGRYPEGSYRYKGVPYLIDEILVPSVGRRHFQRSDGTLAIGFQGEFYKGSDHKLLWAEMQKPRA